MPGRRKQQSFTRRRRAPVNPGSQQQEIEHTIDRAARDLLLNYGPAELRALVARSREACQYADQQAQIEPSPQALRRYNSAARTLAEAERALSLMEESLDRPVG